MDWYLDVVFSYPGVAIGPKGVAVLHLKRDTRWVKYVVRQYGFYPQKNK